MSVIKTLPVILILFCTSAVSNAQYLKELKVKDIRMVYADTLRLKHSSEEKSAFLAGTLSLIVPGLALGQIYNGEPHKFMAHFSISVLSTVMFSLGVIIAIHEETESSKSGGNYYMVASAFIFLGNWVWSIIDAANSADRINREARSKNKHSGILDKLNLGLTVNKNKNFRLKFAIGL